MKLPRVLFSETILKVLPATRVAEILFGPDLKFTVPVGLTTKLTLPNPRFEIWNGLGLVTTEMTHGVAVGLGLGPGLTCGDAPGDAEGLAPGVGLEPGEGDGSAPGDGVGVGLPSAGVGSAVGDADGEADAVGLGVGSGLLLPLVDEPPSMGLRFVVTFTFGTSSR